AAHLLVGVRRLLPALQRSRQKETAMSLVDRWDGRRFDHRANCNRALARHLPPPRLSTEPRRHAAKAVIRDSVQKPRNITALLLKAGPIWPAADTLIDRITSKLGELGDAETIILPGSVAA